MAEDSWVAARRLGKMDLLETRRRKFNVEEYHRMGEVGILHEDDHVEFIAGEFFNSKTGERRFFDAGEYHRMVEAGILREDDRVELIEGEILEMSPIESRHAGCVNRLNKLLVQKVGDATIVHIQNPVRLPNGSEPEPDLALLRLREDFYAEALPTPEDILLLIEVSDTTLEYDCEVKLPLTPGRASPRFGWWISWVRRCTCTCSPRTGSTGTPTRSDVVI